MNTYASAHHRVWVSVSGEHNGNTDNVMIYRFWLKSIIEQTKLKITQIFIVVSLKITLRRHEHNSRQIIHLCLMVVWPDPVDIGGVLFGAGYIWQAILIAIAAIDASNVIGREDERRGKSSNLSNLQCTSTVSECKTLCNDRFIADVFDTRRK